MRFWVGVADNRWFEYVSGRRETEVNFWRPSSGRRFVSLPVGAPFLFKLKRPHNHIVGGGSYVQSTTLPLVMAWNAFGQANGAQTLEAFRLLVQSVAGHPISLNSEIGCAVVTDVHYYPLTAWVPMERHFARNIVSGKRYESTSSAGAALWAEVSAAQGSAAMEDVDKIEGPRYGPEFLTRARLGQGAFRSLITDVYERRCAITGESTLPTLEAAHIKRYADQGPHRLSNGMLLRADFHRLFDLGLVTVTPEHRVLVSRRIHDLWSNGRAYSRLHGGKLKSLPKVAEHRPDPEFLSWHNERFAA